MEAAYFADCGGGLVVYLWGGGRGSSVVVPLGVGRPPGAWGTAGLEGAGEEATSLSTSMGVGVGWSLIWDMADDDSRLSSSGGRLSGCELRSYLGGRLAENELELERRSRSRSRSRSLTRWWIFLSGELGGVPGLLLCGDEVPGVRIGTSGCFGFLDDFVKSEGSTMGKERDGLLVKVESSLLGCNCG